MNSERMPFWKGERKTLETCGTHSIPIFEFFRSTFFTAYHSIQKGPSTVGEVNTASASNRRVLFRIIATCPSPHAK